MYLYCHKDVHGSDFGYLTCHHCGKQWDPGEDICQDSCTFFSQEEMMYLLGYNVMRKLKPENEERFLAHGRRNYPRCFNDDGSFLKNWKDYIDRT